MIKLFFLMIFFLMGSYPLKADEELGSDQEFMTELDNIKNPFEDGLPKPAVIIQKPVYYPKAEETPRPAPIFKPVPVPVTLPSLNLQGVMVGEDMHEAIINDQTVPLLGYIQGARVVSVTKQGVELLYRGKKFFLKVD